MVIKKSGIPLSVVLLLASLLSSSTVSYAQETDESKQTTLLVSSDEKIFLIKDFILPPHDKLSFTFYLYNIGDEATRGLRIIPSSLTLKEGSRFFSSAPSYIELNELVVSIKTYYAAKGEGLIMNPLSYVPDIDKGGALQVSFTLDESVFKDLSYSEATYVGTLQVIGENFETKNIDVEITFQFHPAFYIGFTLGGVVLAIVVGYLYTRWEKDRELEDKMDDDTDIISHINGHIRNINTFRKTIEPTAWNNIYEAYINKKKAVEKYRDQIELDPDAEAVKWFEITDEQMRNSQFFEKNRPDAASNTALLEIEKPDENPTKYSKLRQQRLDEEVKKQHELGKVVRTKFLYVAGTAAISSFASILTNLSFQGNPFITALVGISIGFATYRAQDILKLISSGKEES